MAGWRRESPLSGWLHLTTRNVAGKVVRAEMRRRDREQEAFAMQTSETEADEAVWSRIAPHLDHALAELTRSDRTALLLRFFERKSAREIGIQLGTGEEAAQKRVSRALDRLRAVFVARGLAVPAASLGGVLTANAVQTAPPALAGAVLAAVGMAGSAVSGVGFFHLMTTGKLKLAVALTIAAGVAVTMGRQHRENRQLQAEVAAWRAQAVAPPALPLSADATSPSNPELDELLRLRAEVAQSRRLQRDLELLRAENGRLRAMAPGRNQSGPAAERESEVFKQMGIGKMNVSKNWVQVFWLYANANANALPETFEQAREFYPVADGATADEGMAKAAEFEIMFTGSLKQISNPSSAILLREKAAFPGPDRPGLYRTYAFADGHSEIKYAEDGNFEEWERARQPVLKPIEDGSGSGAQ